MSLMLAANSTYAAEDEAEKPKGFERVAPSMFSAQCLSAGDRDEWSDHSVMRQRYRTRKEGGTKSLSGFPVFEDKSLFEYSLDGKGIVTVTGNAGAERALLLGGIRTTEKHQYCYLNFAGSDWDKLSAALKNERIRPDLDSSVSGEAGGYCSNKLRKKRTPHEIFVFNDIATENASRSELVVRFDMVEDATSCL